MTLFSYASIGAGIVLLLVAAISAIKSLRPHVEAVLPPNKCIEGTVVRYHLDAARDAAEVDVYIPVVEYTVEGRLHSTKLRGSTDKPGATGQKLQLAVDPTQPSNAKLIPDPVAEQKKNRQFAMVTALIGTALCIAGGMGWIN